MYWCCCCLPSRGLCEPPARKASRRSSVGHWNPFAAMERRWGRGRYRAIVRLLPAWLPQRLPAMCSPHILLIPVDHLLQGHRRRYIVSYSSNSRLLGSLQTLEIGADARGCSDIVLVAVDKDGERQQRFVHVSFGGLVWRVRVQGYEIRYGSLSVTAVFSTNPFVGSGRAATFATLHSRPLFTSLMTFAGSVHPLDIPEILLCVGKFIPLWIPKAPIPPAHDVTYLFRPRDLLAAIAVNRTFQRTLTPLLWVVCNFISQRGKFDKINGHYSPPLELLLSCSRHFRFLEFRSIGKDIRLKCTHLQELKLSRWVDRDVGLDLISANKRLTLLSWDFPNLATEPMQEKDYVVLGELKKLKVLQLRHWAVDLDRFLAAGLAPIAAVLEELSLSNIRGFALYRTTVGIGTSYTRSVHAPFTTAVTTTTLPKLKTLLLDRLRGMGNRDCGIDNEVLELIRICPNLETVIIHLDHKCDTEKIGRYLRDHCPKLNAIRCVDMLQSEILLDDEDYVALIQGCVPPSSSKSLSTIDTTRPEGQGLRVFEMGIEWLTSTITGALMAHSDCLETLILYIHSAEVEHFNHACQLLSQCRHLQKFEMYNYRMRWSPCDGMLLLKDPWACRGLKSLALGGFGGRWEEEQDGYPDALQEQQIQQYLEAFDCYSEVIDEHAYDDGHISGRDSSKQGPMSDRKAVLEKKRYRTVTRGDEIILGNWHRSTASMYRNDCLLPGQGFEFKRKFLQVANSLPSLENVSLNYVDYVRGATHEVPLK